MPIAHGEGCYTPTSGTLDELEADDRIAFRYVENPNGSMRDIAGVLSEGRNVLGMMPASGARHRTSGWIHGWPAGLPFPRFRLFHSEVRK